jgi:heat shock protein 110kDa
MVQSNFFFLSSFQGQWHVKDVKPNANGDAQEVKLKVRINTNGIILISSANLVEKNGVDIEEPQSPQPEENPQQPGTEPMEVLEVIFGCIVM